MARRSRGPRVLIYEEAKSQMARTARGHAACKGSRRAEVKCKGRFLFCSPVTFLSQCTHTHVHIRFNNECRI